MTVETEQGTSAGRIGIFGGTFNPIHYGHLRAAEEVREKLGFETILFIPSGDPPLKRENLAGAGDRYEMTRRATEGNPFFEVLDLECRRRGKSYTVDTLEELGRVYPEKERYLILGIDSFLEIPQWHEPERIMAMANFVVISRPGSAFRSLASRIPVDEDVFGKLDASQIAVHRLRIENANEFVLLTVTPLPQSAREIRRLCREGKSIRYLLPDAVESYIISLQLYREGVTTFRK